MSSPTPQSPRSRSQAGGRRPTRPPSHLHSDCPPEPEEPSDSPTLGQRSVSLTTLQPQIIQPRMAQLETLEAKMASIEVSLSSTPRRKKNGCVSLGSSIRSVPKELALKELENLRNALRDKENIIQNLRGQLGPTLNISQLKANNFSNNRELSEIEKKQAEERLSKLKIETDNKRLAIKNLKMAMERLDVSDNIDVRIQQAELEYQLGREELNLLTLLEETRALQIYLEESSKSCFEAQTLYGCVKSMGRSSLHIVEVVYDSKSPKFGASTKDNASGLWIDWALENTGFHKGDRLIEVNGKIIINKTREDLTRLLAAAPDPAQIVLLRKNDQSPHKHDSISASQEVAALRSELGAVKDRAEDTQKAKDGLITDNIRLTHRISYLEEQVSELLCRKTMMDTQQHPHSKQTPLISTVKTNQNVTNINISSHHPNGQAKELQIFQKGPQVTALVTGLEVSKDSHNSLPVRSKSSLSNVSNTHIPAPSPQPSENSHKSHNKQHHRTSKSKSEDPHKQQQRTPSGKEYYSETSEYHRKNTGAILMDKNYKRASMIVHDLTKEGDGVYENHRQKCLAASEKYNMNLLKHFNARKSTSVLDFRSQTRYPDSRSTERLEENEKNHHHNHNHNRRRIIDARSVQSLDFDSDCSRNIDYTSEPLDNNNDKIHHHHNQQHHNHPVYIDNIKPRPTPPKKPLRLSLHKTQSLQSVETPSFITPNGSPDKNDNRKSLKRNHKGESQLIPILNIKIEGGNDHRHKLKDFQQHKGPINGLSALKWSNFNPAKFIENNK